VKKLWQGIECVGVSLFVRALFAFLALPGVVAFAAPAWIVWTDAGGRAFNPWGLVSFVLGVALLVWCVRAFYVAGRGTLAPWDPPTDLVVTGPYRRSRNPMYVAVDLILVGWLMAFGSHALWVYVPVVAIAFHLRVVFGEEPYLARVHGERWARYRARVRRWL
jgi:protein-S-isoprenylcysteine O-methyltransferase Ste14